MKNLALVCHSERQRRIFFMLTRKILRLRCASLRMTVRGNALRFAQDDKEGHADAALRMPKRAILMRR